jgi:Nucleotidyltransferase
VGGWAHRLYRLHPYAQPLEYPPLTTLDADVAVPPIPWPTQQDMRDRLLASGFSEELLGDDQPPAAHYHFGDESGGFYAEFLTPLVGGNYDRKGKRKVTARIAGVAAQPLRHIDLLMLRPWIIDFDPAGTFEERRRVRIANPATFLAQKILIHTKRSREDRAKDLLYVHDTLEVFGSRLDQLRDEWEEWIAPRLHRKHLGQVRSAAAELFGATSGTIRMAATIAIGRSLAPESLREACRFGLMQLFR